MMPSLSPKHRAYTGAVRERRPEWHRWYYLKVWQDIRQRQLQHEPLCRDCTGRGIATVAEHVDHIEDHKGDWFRFIHGPFQSLCHSCHSRKTRRSIHDTNVRY